MSMMCRVMGLSLAQVHALRATPSLAGDVALVVEGGKQTADFDQSMKLLPAGQRAVAEAQYRAAVAALGPAPGIGAAQARIAELGPLERMLDLQKAWHILHFLFTGHADTSDAPGDALLTGEPLGEDLGYGPARLHDAGATQAFNRFLEALEVGRLQARVDLREMRRLGVYSMPVGPDSEATYERHLRDEVGHAFSALRDYVREMSTKGDGLLVWLS